MLDQRRTRDLIFALALLLSFSASCRDLTLPAPATARVANATAELSLGKAGEVVVLQEDVGGANYLQLHLVVHAPRPLRDARLSVETASGKEVDSLPLNGVVGVHEFWSKTIAGKNFRLSVLGSTDPSARVVVKEVYRDSKPAEVLSIVGPDNREKLADLDKNADKTLLAKARATGRLLFYRDGDGYVCTAFFIGGRQMMTNEHCLSESAGCLSGVVWFDYLAGESVPGESQRHCTRVIASSAEYDYAVFELDTAPPAGIEPVVFGRKPPKVGDALIVIEHPRGEVEQVSRKECKAHSAEVDGNGAKTDFQHECDTLNGSSGSGVFTTDFRIVGLHHLGFDTADPADQQYNRAVGITGLLAALKTRNIAVQTAP